MAFPFVGTALRFATGLLSGGDGGGAQSSPDRPCPGTPSGVADELARRIRQDPGVRGEVMAALSSGLLTFRTPRAELAPFLNADPDTFAKAVVWEAWGGGDCEALSGANRESGLQQVLLGVVNRPDIPVTAEATTASTSRFSIETLARELFRALPEGVRVEAEGLVTKGRETLREEARAGVTPTVVLGALVPVALLLAAVGVGVALFRRAPQAG